MNTRKRKNSATIEQESDLLIQIRDDTSSIKMAFKFKFKANDTVGSAKAKFHRKETLKRQPIWTHNDEMLSDEKTLSESNIYDGDLLTIIGHLK